MSLDDAIASARSSAQHDRRAVGGYAKRLFDIFGSTALILFFLPLMGLIWLSVKLTDGGPAIFAHRRIGRRRREFRCLKFRSMVRNADEVLRDHLAASAEARREWRESQKLRDDPRITPIGRLLRVSSADELPQLFNVLRGDMSLVGPRPIVEAETDHYGGHLHAYLAARPGITGLWQVSGRSDTTYQSRVQLDVEYVRCWSMWNDVLILFRTIWVVVRREGSR